MASRFDTFTTAYLEAMFWAENPSESDESCDDLGFTIDDLDPAGLAEILSDCRDFQKAHWNSISGSLAQAGHDFYLTRNRHGAGFWDGDWPEDIARRLTDAAHVYGTQGLMCADEEGNGPLYVHN